MKKRPIRIMDRDFRLQAEIEDYESFTLTRHYDTFGSFELRINQNKNNVEHLKKGAVLFLSEEKAGMIQHREYMLDEGGKQSQILTIRGYTLEHLLTYRITEILSGKESYEGVGAAEDIIKNMISYNLGSLAVNKSRLISEIFIMPSKGRGKQTAVSACYSPLDEECRRLLSQSELGLKITLDYNEKKFLLDVYQGRQLTTEQVVNPPVIFSEEFDNIADENLVDSLLEYKNTAVVTGQEKGGEEKTELINNENKGLERREVLIDVGSMEKDSVVTLKERGTEGLLDYKPVYSLEGTVIPFSSFHYGVDYELGDMVTVRFQDAHEQIYMDTRIAQVTESYDDSGEQVEVVFGDRIPTMADKLKRIAKGGNS